MEGPIDGGKHRIEGNLRSIALIPEKKQLFAQLLMSSLFLWNCSVLKFYPRMDERRYRNKGHHKL